MAAPAPMVIAALVARHFEEAATLWHHRDADVHGTQRTLEEMEGLDGRVVAHLHGLRVAQGYGWDEATIEPDLSDAGEAFVRVLLAVEAKKLDTLEHIFQAAESDAAAARGVVSAFGWASSNDLRGTVRELLSSSHPFKRRVGIAACAVHRADPGDALRQAIVDGDETLKRRALRAVGELGLTAYAPLLRTHYRADDLGCRFWAAWSSVLTGDRAEGFRVLSSLGSDAAGYRGRAMQVVLRILSANGAREWLQNLRDNTRALRDVVVGAGITGDPSYIPWLIAQMDVPEHSRLAGESFSMITGIDLYDAQLTRDRPEGFESGPTDDVEDEDVAMDPDTALVWPDAQLIRQWWKENGHRCVNGQRYLAGGEVSEDHCRRMLRDGRQGVRQAAAFELALMNPDAPLFEIRAPAFRQRRQLIG